ncbi:MAG: cadmium-translocating P-type ATPase [Ignavibacteriota bacterium]|nr:cadmium-translocating P-type ATPase [Ignavibacteriota bacterium]MCC7094842.1 cadmium-translocating P-type ATPase [Ignavibacteriaceae bacterium]MEB2297879.1 copper-translocating P-type ATPase [Ignavibacteria bacterium]QKJ96847.1 MAG: cadmium-translocating P-type ATPase [Ignavibacteriota bacterium]GJQ41496.1 MAG: heavy metal translocating P-type ATPase [Ignavibacteriaceae bacterium]
MEHHTSHTEHNHHKVEHQQHSSHSQSGHDKHAGHNVADFWKRFIVCLIVSIPVLALSHMIQQWLGFELSFPGDKYVLAFLSTFIFIYGGFPFLKGLYDEVKDKAIGMMTLIGVAISVAWIYSVAITFGLQGMDFYWEMATLIDIMLIGHYFEMKSVMGASRSLELLVKMMPSTAHHIMGENIHDMPVSNLQIGDMVMVKPGEKVPVDGIVAEGESYVDESMLTGESKPVKKEKDVKVIGGAINGNGSLIIKVISTGKDSYLNKVVKLVEDAQKIKSKTQNFADRAAKVLTFVALGGGVITLVVWLLLDFPFVFALERMVTVMVISCPHALGLAVPLVVAISTSISARKGLLIRNRTAFENARLISTIIFDKTGTLTKGSHELQEVKVLNPKFDERELLRLAAGIEQHSEHYIAAGLIRKVKELNIKIPKSENFNYLPGKGLEGIVEEKEIKVVGPNYLKEQNIGLSEMNDEFIGTVVYVLIDNQVSGYFIFSDQIRETAFEAIQILKEVGIKNLLLTGDNEKVAKKVSTELKMDGYLANVLPHEKLEKVKELQQKGEYVAMTGDGVNDAPALAQADVGIAVGSGTDVAAETADIILVNSDPKDIASLILFGKATYNKMIQNLWWAAGYNIVAIPLAAGVLFKWDILLSPAIGAVLMSLSTIVVAINAQLLKRQLH